MIGADGVTADLNASWRNLMTAIGQGVPYGLNRAVKASRNLHRAVI